jgi:hypothetical protein
MGIEVLCNAKDPERQLDLRSRVYNILQYSTLAAAAVEFEVALLHMFVYQKPDNPHGITALACMVGLGITTVLGERYTQNLRSRENIAYFPINTAPDAQNSKPYKGAGNSRV